MSKKPNTKGGRLTSPRRKLEAFGGAKKGMVICETCNIFYYKKSWHHDADTFVAARANKDIPVSFATCPACALIKSKQFKGRVLIKNVPAAQKADLLNLIKGYCDRAFDRDPLERLISVTQAGNSVTVNLTNNQLAQRLGKKIKDAFNKVKLTMAYLREPGDVANVTIEFLAK